MDAENIIQFVIDVVQRTDVGVITMLLLIVLLVQKELLRAYHPERFGRAVRSMNVVIAPLLALYTVVIMVRFLTVIGTI